MPSSPRKKIVAVISWGSLFLFLSLVSVWFSQRIFWFDPVYRIYSTLDKSPYPHRRVLVSLHWSEGMQLWYYRQDGPQIPAPPRPANGGSMAPIFAWESGFGKPQVIRAFGIRWLRRPNFTGSNDQEWFAGWVCSLTLPHWFLVIPLLAFPLYGSWSRFLDWNRRRHWRAGMCRKCGYDLRASKERCPECGEAIPSLVNSDCPADSIP